MTITSTDLTAGETFESIGGPTLTVTSLSYGLVPLDEVLDGTARPVAAIATQDGRWIVGGWHEGPEAEAIYFERYDSTGRTSHGWIDSASRRLVQAG